MEQDERRARAAIGEGFCPDCVKPLEPRAGKYALGWCRACGGYWVDGEIGLQVTETGMLGLWPCIVRLEHFPGGVRKRVR